MYFTNYPRPAEQYFQTVAAHSVYSDSIIPDDMRFIWWPQVGWNGLQDTHAPSNSSGCVHSHFLARQIGGRGAQHPADLTKEYLQPLSESGAFFARKFKTSPGTCCHLVVQWPLIYGLSYVLWALVLLQRGFG